MQRKVKLYEQAACSNRTALGTAQLEGYLHSNASAAFYEQITVPASVAEYIEVNPAYTAVFKDMSSCSEAYFRGRVWGDWESIENHLPHIEPDTESVNILDLGSGVAGINIALINRYENADITLVDKSNRQGFDVQKLGVSLLKRNFSEIEVRGLGLGSKEIRVKSYDLIVSLRALGYMFPYAYYAETIRRCLKRNGSLILDISTRRDDGNEIIRRRFGKDSGTCMVEVFAELARAIGVPKVIFKGLDYYRVHVTRTVA